MSSPLIVAAAVTLGDSEKGVVVIGFQDDRLQLIAASPAAVAPSSYAAPFYSTNRLFKNISPQKQKKTLTVAPR